MLTPLVRVGNNVPRRKLFLRFDFVATKRFLGFGEHDVLAKLGAVLAQRQLVRGIHGIFGRIIDALAAFFADESDDLTLVAFFGHFKTALFKFAHPILTDTEQIVNCMPLANRFFASGKTWQLA